MKTLTRWGAKSAAVAFAIVTAAAVAVTPTAQADKIKNGNYEVLTDRWNNNLNSWIWAVSSCEAVVGGDCVNVVGVPRPNKSARIRSTAFRGEDNRYTMTVDTIDGLYCNGYRAPTQDVYNFDALTLVGTIVSSFDVGCNGAPGGSYTWGFSLLRL